MEVKSLDSGKQDRPRGRHGGAGRGGGLGGLGNGGGEGENGGGGEGGVNASTLTATPTA